MKKILPLIFCFLLASGIFPQTGEPTIRADGVLSLEVGPGVYFEVDPRMELLSGIFLWTGDRRQPPVQYPPTAYGRELKALIRDHQTSGGVTLTDKMQKEGFSFDAPPASLLWTSGGLALQPIAEAYPPVLEHRAGGRARLDTWMGELRTLGEKVQFSKFFQSTRPYYSGLLKRAALGSSADRLVPWMLRYFRVSGNYRFHYLLAPGMFSSGGYGPRVDRMEGGQQVHHIYQIVRGADEVRGQDLDGLSLHEFSHSFVNPAMGDQLPASAKNGINNLFAPVKEKMDSMAYGTMETFLNELFVRAATIRGSEELISGFNRETAFLQEEAQGFYPIREAYRLLGTYEAGSKPFFEEGPRLAQALADRSGELLAAYRENNKALRLRSSFQTGFEGLTSAPGPELVVDFGVTGSGRSSEVLLDVTDAASGQNALTLKGDGTTQVWKSVGLPLEVKAGVLRATWKVRGNYIRKEGRQYDNAYVGIIGEEVGGKRFFHIQSYRDTFPWKTDSLSLQVDPGKIRNLQFLIFLSKSGELSVDDISLAYD